MVACTSSRCQHCRHPQRTRGTSSDRAASLDDARHDPEGHAGGGVVGARERPHLGRRAMAVCSPAGIFRRPSCSPASSTATPRPSAIGVAASVAQAMCSWSTRDEANARRSAAQALGKSATRTALLLARLPLARPPCSVRRGGPSGGAVEVFTRQDKEVRKMAPVAHLIHRVARGLTFALPGGRTCRGGR